MREPSSPHYLEAAGSLLEADRRQALKLLSASLAVVVSGCSRPSNDIIPYVNMPERLVPGVPLYFASAMSTAGFAQPAIVETHEGRPTKIEGNPTHPSSGGATDAFTQAQIYALYDPYRLRAMQQHGQIAAWDGFLGALVEKTARWRADKGRGLRLLTGRITSPMLGALIQDWLKIYPLARWHAWEPTDFGDAQRATELAFARPLDVRWNFARARTILALDGDFLGPGPSQTRHARDFASGRHARAGAVRLTRLYSAGPSQSLTSANADHTLRIKRGEIPDLVLAVAAALGAPTPAPQLSAAQQIFIDAAVADLRAEPRGSALVHVGACQPPPVQAAVWWINSAIGAIGGGVEFIAALDAPSNARAGALDELTRDIHAGEVGSLIILDANPAYDAPGDLAFADALTKVDFTACSALEVNETLTLSEWQIPSLHPMESWADLADTTGAVTLVQPMIEPLYDSRSAASVLRATMELPAVADYDLLRAFWRGRGGASDFEQWWRRALHDGVVTPGAAASVKVSTPVWPSDLKAGDIQSDYEITFDADASTFDGRFAQNPWLQELPQPVTRQVWGNQAEVSRADAARLGVKSGDALHVETPSGAITIAAYVSAGRAEGSIGLRLGGGRRTGPIGAGVGADISPLRRYATPWSITDATVTKAQGLSTLLVTQTIDRTAGEDILRTFSHTDLDKGIAFPHKRLDDAYPAPPLPSDDYSWGMAIDLTTCVGCNACVIACQVENNIPVVGPEEVARGRDMHWLRIDTYALDVAATDIAFQPTPCMQCEKAPCEPVCPVEASVHDSEGLNVQVYNRCVGTRFCQSNCPYKVRRFNFFGYADGQEYKGLGDPSISAARNPDVSVRARGVMEKCTYCVQRISHARREAEKETRLVKDGDVRTACQQACPTQAITFGNLQDETSAVSSMKRQPHNYAMLEDLGTRPRTTYLARVRNRHTSETEK